MHEVNSNPQARAQVLLYRVGYRAFVFVEPCFDRLAVMDSQVVKDQDHLAPCILDQSLHELDEAHAIFAGLIIPIHPAI